MAYSPTTWNTNDVITKDKLNKIEQGVKTATRLSGTDIDTDKDWGGKAIANVGAITGQGIRAVQKKSYAVSDTVIHNLPEERSIKGDSFGTTHAIVVPQGYMTSTFRIRFDYRMGQSKRGGLFRVLRNGREIMSTSRIYETAWTTALVDVTGVEPGDVFSLQAAATDWGDYAYTRNFQVCGEVETYTRMIGSSDTTW